MRVQRWLVCAFLTLSTLGCATCANPHDCKYAAYGGLRDRADRVHGRVGSVLDPAAEVASTGAEQLAAPEPTPAAGPATDDAPIDVPAPMESASSDPVLDFVDVDSQGRTEPLTRPTATVEQPAAPMAADDERPDPDFAADASQPNDSIRAENSSTEEESAVRSILRDGQLDDRSVLQLIDKGEESIQRD